MDYTKAMQELDFMQQAYGTLFSVTNKLQIRGDEYLEDLTSRQFMTIVAILHLSEGETTINNIARKLGTSKQNANRLVASLESKGYLLSAPSEKDKRAVNVKLTKAGNAALKKCGEKSVYFMAKIFSAFSTQEIETLWNLLKKLYSFDGETQDGFEENINTEYDENSGNRQSEIMKQFIALREAKK
jgi:DNA-binding MarR family transcriptional regulator